MIAPFGRSDIRAMREGYFTFGEVIYPLCGCDIFRRMRNVKVNFRPYRAEIFFYIILFRFVIRVKN